MLPDLRYAFRNLRRTPIFTTAALVSLALGIGANTAVFTVADQVLLRPLPVRHAAQLLQFTSPGPYSGFVMGENRFSYPMFRDLRDNAAGFEAIGARFSTPLSLTYNNRSERIQAELVSGTWFDTLGLAISLGRPLGPDDDRVPGGHSVCVLTYDFWRSRFSADRAIVNKVLLLNGHPMGIVGVAARGYRGFDVGDRSDILVPTMMKAAMTPAWNGLEDRRFLWLQVVGRLRPGMTVETAQARLQPFFHALLRIEAESMTFRSSRLSQEFASKPLILVPTPKGVSDLRAELSAPIRILTAIVALLLLIACANVANLLLARAAARQKEIAIRLAMGAPRGRLVRQLVVESVVLSVAGGAIGLIVAAWTVSGLLGILAHPGGMSLTASLDARVFAYTFALSAVTGFVFGLAPAWQATEPGIATVLKDQAGAIVLGAGHVRLRKALVVSQVAISLLMLIAAALFTRSLRNLNAVDLGFGRDRLMSFQLDPSLNGYTPERIRVLAETLQQKLAAIPGVRTAAVGANPVIADNTDVRTIRFATRPNAEDEDLNPSVDSVSPDYFTTMEIPLLAGRDFTPRDRAGAPRVAIVNDVFARHYFPGESPIGQHFGFGHDRSGDIEIVGVVRASKYSRIDEQARRVVYTPLLQEAAPSVLVAYVRTTADPRAAFVSVRREVAQLDGSLPITEMRTMTDQVAEALSAQRLMATLAACFAALATVLAAIGLYGVMAYLVTRRKREIGLRLALGADPAIVRRSVMREAAMMTSIGVGLAIPAGIALGAAARSQLFGVAPWDPLSILGSSAAVASIALLAAWIPAARAVRVVPVRALRHE
jgi:predicted permease